MLYVISGPTGSGKTTIANELTKSGSIKKTVSHTTRKIRAGETEGVDYFFVSEQKFQEMIDNNEFVEYEKVHNHYYGTSIATLNSAATYDTILTIDVKGALNIKKSFDDSSLIFIFPPDFSEWIKRIDQRGESAEEELKIRMKTALFEIENYEKFDYIIINEDLRQSVRSVLEIIDSSKLRVKAIKEKIKPLAEKLAKQIRRKYL